MTSALGTTTYAYDNNYQLTGATYPNVAPFNGEVHSWTYDNLGNRLTNTIDATTQNYTYYKNGSNPLNGQRLQSDGSKNYSYNFNGNLTSDATNTYTWDFLDRLKTITGPGMSATYNYDYMGRRTQKTVNGVTTTFLYDGADLIGERTGNNIDYLFGAGIDQPLASKNGSSISYFAVDGLGSINSLNDPAGTVQNSYAYDAWGVLRNQTGSTPNLFGYTGREFGESGLMFYRERYYSPAIGKFISEDPLRFTAGVNFYSYVLNDPVNFIDPSGLKLVITRQQAEIMTDQMEAMTVAAGIALIAAYAWELLVPSAPVMQQAAQKCSVQQNREIGNKFRDEIADLLQKEGLDVVKEVYKRTIFGKRFIDIEVSKGGQVLGGIETKTGNSAYTTSQRAKDAWLRLQGYIVNLVRDKCGCD
jgi:RHS repeat-associated protein